MDYWIAFAHQHWGTIFAVASWAADNQIKMLGILLSWPAVVLYLGTAILLIYRTEIAVLIQRIESGEIGGLKVRLQPQPKIEEETINAEPIKAAVIEAKADIQEHSDKLSATAGHVSPHVKRLVDASDRMIAQSKAAIEALFFERAMNVIYGTQLRFLSELRHSGETVPISQASHFFADYKRIKPTGRVRDFPGWAKWLVTTGLINIDETADTVSLTEKGRKFVDYVERRYPGGLFREG